MSVLRIKSIFSAHNIVMIFPPLKVYGVSSLADEIEPSDIEAMLPAILVGNAKSIEL
jgi:hypothetical protein